MRSLNIYINKKISEITDLKFKKYFFQLYRVIATQKLQETKQILYRISLYIQIDLIIQE